ncbi:RNase H-fold protein (predicted Holliday junction resolvase) [Halanaerobium saccharolyticum]|uniref:RNase H-fold protein (Predicted Holliday junction resolvase) n=1 Tax=Halanaerobium saccharolyticum TaxID=43595 RepID=A0A4R7ZEA3_9FIRM|nr:Holliday junction resolvase RuvX [Halanaerobium saccharolyticum]RAK09788.1 RNase H-fold protein (predicted Holliday junction resolvase) [Halanaerobium saccharolyticum]TDW07350.1 RNase H-fold protein (predicted Holliday junction resolvase) [Halanaerobium saccharolyticum]TDX61229.1 RNase H-fold protein (predicted Holliday junction resolvase) [Halanaerobium saccharolyticum]
MSDLLALDPGSDKVGTAVLSFTKDEREKTIVKKEELLDHLKEIFSHYQIEEIVIGNGTGAEAVKEMISSAYPDLEITLIEEKYTTEEAQTRYLEEKPMSNYEKLLRKMVSWKVKKPLDDYAALIIGEKYLKKIDEDD